MIPVDLRVSGFHGIEFHQKWLIDSLVYGLTPLASKAALNLLFDQHNSRQSVDLKIVEGLSAQWA